MSNWENKTVLITGACGTIGKELLRQLSTQNVARIVGIDNNESELFFVKEQYKHHDNISLFLGDLRDKDKMVRKARGVDIILHTAALKHVILCEESPQDAIQTNIIGTQNIIDAAQLNGVQKVLFTSSDKAVNSTNVMGTSKLMGERLMTAANALRSHVNDPIFFSTRFGNVLGSRGSVLPLFKKQIAQSGPVTLTDPNMTRFIMTIEDAAQLVLDSVWLAKGGEVFVTKMPVARIEDLATVMVQELAPKYGHTPSDIEIKTIGVKSGEKLYEELMSDEEIRRTVDLGKFFVVQPAFKSVYEKIKYEYGVDNTPVDNPYNSAIEETMSQEALKDYLSKYKLLEGN